LENSQTTGSAQQNASVILTLMLNVGHLPAKFEKLSNLGSLPLYFPASTVLFSTTFALTLRL
jgi:hypothetical protein